MPSMQLHRDDVIVGVDTHKDQHVAVVLDGYGGHLAELSLPATDAGFTALSDLALSHVGTGGRLIGFGIEGTSSYGLGLARHLRHHGHRVHEVQRPTRSPERRLTGKNDTIDAEHAARQLLTGATLSTPKTADGQIEAIRLLKIDRDGAVKARTAAMVTLKAILVTASTTLRAEFETLTGRRLIVACLTLNPTHPTHPATFKKSSPGSLADPNTAMRHVLASLAQRWEFLNNAVKTATQHLEALTMSAAPQLRGAVGIGADAAAELLIAVGDNPDRIHSEAAFAKLCGVCPIPAGSGKTNGRHRLNRGGNRQANAALYRAVIVRLRWHQPTIDYAARRTTEGLSKRDIIRCLKRYLAREIYRLLPGQNQPSSATTKTPETLAA